MASDAELIGCSLAGDGDAFVEMIGRHESAIWAYLLRRAGRPLAEDLLGEVWAAAFASRSSYNLSFPDARPWLFGVALNTLRRHWRSHEQVDSLPERAAVGTDPWPGVDDWIDGERILRAALAQIEVRQREVLALVVWEDLSVAEAARALGIPAGTARYLLHQARLGLREAPGMVRLLNELNVVKETSAVRDPN